MQEEEIELIYLFRILWKRRKFILLGTLFLSLSAVGISLVMPKVYEVSTIIEPGLVIVSKGIATPESIRENILGEAYHQAVNKNLNLSAKNLSIKFKVVVPKGTSLVKISIESSDAQQAVTILEELNKQIALSIDEKIEVEISQINNEIKLAQIHNQSLDEKLKLANSQVASIVGKIKDLEDSKKKAMSASRTDAMSVLLYSNDIQSQQIYLNGFQEKIKNLEAETLGSDLRIDNLRLALSKLEGINLVKSPTVPKKPIKPKISLIVALAFMLGLMGTMLLAFLLEYFERAGGVRAASKENS